MTISWSEFTMPHKYCKAVANSRLITKLPAMIDWTVEANEDSKTAMIYSSMYSGVSNCGTLVTYLISGTLLSVP